MFKKIKKYLSNKKIINTIGSVALTLVEDNLSTSSVLSPEGKINKKEIDKISINITKVLKILLGNKIV